MSHDSYRFGAANGINEYFFEPPPSARLLVVSNRRLTSLCLVEVSLNCSPAIRGRGRGTSTRVNLECGVKFSF